MRTPAVLPHSTPTRIENFYWRESVTFSTTRGILISLIAIKAFFFFKTSLRIPLYRLAAPLLCLCKKNFKAISAEFCLLSISRSKYMWWHRINSQILLGAIPLEEHSKALQGLGITGTLSILEKFETTTKFIRYKPIGETKLIEVPDLAGLPPHQVNEAIEWLQTQVEKGEVVYVHCKAGRGRSPMVLVAYFMRHGIPENRHPTREQVVTYLKTKRPEICLSPDQHAKIDEWYTLELLKTKATDSSSI